MGEGAELGMGSKFVERRVEDFVQVSKNGDEMIVGAGREEPQKVGECV